MRYGSAWSAIIQLVRDGHSWSGNERNRLLLNCGEAGFADVSSSVGLDHEGDGRALAIVDWDQDGDLDLWYRDRSAPRLRLMLNRHAPAQGARDFVALKLEGTTCNRDAIGAVVEVMVKGAPGRLVKSVRAGDLFLSQSSRWLHFGLAEAGVIREIRVRWPGSGWEVFADTEVGGAYLLKQGSGATAKIERTPRKIQPATEAVPLDALRDQGARIILPAKIPLPPIGYRNVAGQPQMIAVQGKPQIVLLWSASCRHCRRELAALATAADRLRSAGLEVTALSVDVGGDAVSDAYNLMDAVKWPFAWGMIESDAIDRVDEFQRALFDLTVPMAVPLTLLCDRKGNVAAIYRGELEMEDLLEDLKALEDADEARLHALAPPFAGRWFTKPVDPTYAVEFMARQFEGRLAEDALFYLDAAMQRATGDRRSALGQELAGKHLLFARQYKTGRNPQRAAAHFESALALGPRAEVYLDYGTMLASYGKLGEAKVLLERALALEPNLKQAVDALALVRKLIAEGK
jgi:tetratricopeptide (TPR) repeat protein